MKDELIKKLLEAGVHFGHQTKRWNPKMKKYIFGERSGIYIIDLEKTVDHLNSACDVLRDIASKGGSILFVGTKKQAQDVIDEEAKRGGMFYVKNRWLGGLLTNFQTVKKSIDRMKAIEQMNEDGTFDELTKKEIARLTKEKDKLSRDLSGIRDMARMPQAIFLVDSKKEEIAVHEASKLGITIVGLIDTNCDPDKIDYVIPGNDDALKSIKVITAMLTDSILEGRKEHKETTAAQEKAEAAAAAETNVPEVEVLKEEIEKLEETAMAEDTTKRGPTKVRLARERKP